MTLANVGLGLALALIGCGGDVPSMTATPTSVPSVSVAPTAGPPGQLHLTMKPPYDCCDLQLRYILADESTVKGESIRGDIEVIVNRPFSPGVVQVVYNDVTCEGSVEIAPDQESDVVMDLGRDPRCRLLTTETHPLGSIQHPDQPLTAHVGADLPLGLASVFVLQSLDTPEAPPTARIAVEKAPWEVRHIKIEPGRYELSVLENGVVLGSLREDLVRGSDWIFNLRFLPRNVTRDCGDIVKATCERVAGAAYAWGLFPSDQAQYVTVVRVRPSAVESCMAPIEAPLYDVTFEMANPKGAAEATVGRLPNGRYDACSY
ncbi:MAG TPA: hypothetical protein VFP56_02610 [Candidatus Limnocylindrales bacterium]|nr:hypothetical protein [Candidatus Limnocylindrales bacterium]